MSTITTIDGTEIYYKDWGKGPAVTLSHGWPLSADAWDGQMWFLAQNGFRVTACRSKRSTRSVVAWRPTARSSTGTSRCSSTRPTGRATPCRKACSTRSAGLIKNCKDVYYPAAPHGLTATHQDQINTDLFRFLQS